MLTIRWDTLVVVVVGLTASFLVVQVLVRIAAARLIGARSTDEPKPYELDTERRHATPRESATASDLAAARRSRTGFSADRSATRPSARRAWRHDAAVDATRHTPPGRQVS